MNRYDTTLSGNILTPDGWLRGEISLEDGRIAVIDGEPVNPDDNEAPRILPGFIDLHVHGGGGADAMEGGDAVATLARTHARFGTTSVLATTMTARCDDIERALSAIARLIEKPPEQAADIFGVHLEGPFINAAKLGAQPPHARPGTIEEIEHYMGLAPIRLVTLAPELEGHDALIRHLVARDVKVQLGHTCGSYEDGVHALACGASGFTHLYNAMTALNHRDPGIVGTALAHARYAEIIPDLLHVEAGAVLSALRCIPDLYGVTDATAAAGMPEGQYKLGENAVYKRGGAVRLSDGTLAGSALTMDQALRNFVSLGLTPAEASHRLSTLPAQFIGLEDRGRLATGLRADLAIFSPKLTLDAVYVAGQIIRRKQS
ncbi:N-acetylglucosamine-6-phosphate deacetylase [Phytohalomonas tamaricis]|uniref:N-acetylglucosamine-6-phosphate deacetylase n=1 Tax=Phytohalomonas tamaricis TaxID=2081032 RepID=UPI000D0B4043|nr:N-acetylglucosamine-6-phosphate deacetylase [Phytohalomonas tamaricis]